MKAERALDGLSWSGGGGVYRVEGGWSVVNLNRNGVPWLATSGDGRQEQASSLQGIGNILRELKKGGVL